MPPARGVFVAGLFVLALYQGLPEADARALTFTALVATNLGLVILNRSRGERLWTSFRRRNTALWLVAGATGAMLGAIVAIEPMRQLFHFGPLHAGDVAVALSCGVVMLAVLGSAQQLVSVAIGRSRHSEGGGTPSRQHR